MLSPRSITLSSFDRPKILLKASNKYSSLACVVVAASGTGRRITPFESAPDCSACIANNNAMLEQQEQLDLDEGSSSSWRLLRLPDILAQHVLSFLPENTVPYAVRLTCKDAATSFDSPQHKTFHVGPKHPPIPIGALLARWGTPGTTSSLTCRQRYTMLSAAARTGDIPTMQQLLITTGCVLNLDIISTAAESRQSVLVSWLLQHENCPITIRTRPHDLKEASVGLMKAAISSGSVETCEVMHRELLKLTELGFDLGAHPDLPVAAARSGSPAVCTWLRQRGTGFGLSDPLGIHPSSNTGCVGSNTSPAPGDSTGGCSEAVQQSSCGGAGGEAAAAVPDVPAEEQLPKGACKWEWALEQLAADRVKVVIKDFLSDAAHDCDLPALQRVYDKYMYGSGRHPDTGSTSGGGGRRGEGARRGGAGHALDSEGSSTEDDDDSTYESDWSDADARAEVLVAALCSPTPDWEAKVRLLLAKGYPRKLYCSTGRLAACSYAVERMQWMAANKVTLHSEEAKELAHSAAAYGNVPLLRYLLDKGAMGRAGGTAGGSDGQSGSGSGSEGGDGSSWDGSSDGSSWHTDVAGGEGGESDGSEEESDWDGWEDPITLMFIDAAEGGHLEVLKLLVESGYKLKLMILRDGAAGSGKVELVEWCLEQLCGEVASGGGNGSGEGDASGDAGSGEAAGTCPAGATPSDGQQHDQEREQQQQQQQEEVDRRRRERRLLGPKLMVEAAWSGSMSLVQWLHARGCAWGEEALCAAAMHGSLELVEWMAAQGCPMPAEGEPYIRAGGLGYLAMMDTLKRLGCSFGPCGGAKLFGQAVEYRLRLPVLKWLYGNGCRAVWSKGMAKARDPQVADWLRATVQEQAEGPETQEGRAGAAQGV